ncbi:hypothetical protein [Kitasatospora kifunensis]|uniref:Threonine dehydrogenase-like Zn-dependent dehydrogenase n=1 Tax=Kitasatospora kifunensis TaxID=58351 RepID=A0A7W7R660_KITKI|nr:hypothetical protein [Kitasatospora kifunensis]MBB4926147.1 threonine dehydrogenase-like Zn-dependent dehydrogenase [Kitasatospora kifunensis]
MPPSPERGALVVEEVPDPVPQSGQLLVRTLACGICGCDLHALGDPEAFSDIMRRTGVTGLDGLAGAIAELGDPERHAKIVVDPSLVAG